MHTRLRPIRHKHRELRRRTEVVRCGHNHATLLANLAIFSAKRGRILPPDAGRPKTTSNRTCPRTAFETSHGGRPTAGEAGAHTAEPATLGVPFRNLFGAATLDLLTPCGVRLNLRKTWMPATRAGMTREKRIRSLNRAECSPPWQRPTISPFRSPETPRIPPAFQALVRPRAGRASPARLRP